MRRRSRAGDETVKTRRQKAATLKRRNATKAARGHSSSIAVLQEQLDRRTHELSDALEQQKATAEVLQVISSSPGDLQPVFQTMLENATRICEANFGHLQLHENGVFRIGATHNVPPAFAEALAQRGSLRPGPLMPLTRLIETKQLVHIADYSEHAAYKQRDPAAVRMVELGGARTTLLVPMLKENELIGVIAIYRQEVRPFTNKQIALVQNFATQAVIAIENTRLLNELRQSLQQQTATADVLKAISRSAFDLQTVLDTLTESAARLCEADMAAVTREKDAAFYYVTSYGFPADFLEFIKSIPHPVDRKSVIGRALIDGKAVQLSDVLADAGYGYLESQNKGGYRTLAGVPLIREGTPIGVLLVGRSNVRPFTQKQIELVSIFADQAVVAIENTRLLNELRQRTDDLTESLDQQTATAEVLKVISRSAFDLQPVFDTMAENAVKLCEAERAFIFRFDGKLLRAIATYNVGPELREFADQNPIAPGRHSISARAALERRTVQVADIQADPEFSYATRDVELIRTILAVPILKGDDLVGVITIYRLEIKPFTDKQVALVETFAAQAVIAIENTRLLNELRESLQQQTATAEVLKVISRSTFNLQLVLDTLVESATRLCEAQDGFIFLPDGNVFRAAARFGFTPEHHKLIESNPVRIDRGTVSGRTAVEGRVVHVADVLTDPEFVRHDVQKIGGFRAALGVPLLRGGKVIGVIFLSRTKPQPFSDKQIDLVTTFADQAVIAIENVRLFEAEQQRRRELSESLEQQTATADVLRVISSSPGVLEPVFEAMLKNAARICSAKLGHLLLLEGPIFRAVAIYSKEGHVDSRRNPVLDVRENPGTPIDSLFKTKQVVHIPDLRTDQSYVEKNDRIVALVEAGGARTFVTVPMLKDDDLIGAISMYRDEVCPFTDKQIEFLQNFANQAVIAIENTRLLNELRQSLEQQTATVDVLRVISSSPGELEPVFQAMLENATRICEAKFGVLNLHENGTLRMGAMHNVPSAFAEWLQNQRGGYRPIPGSPLDQVIRTKQLSVTVDNAVEAAPGRATTLGGARSTVCVPMIKDNELVGTITIYRQEVRPFTDKQITLLQNFAAQAVIAIENTRLLNELRESLQQQTATSEVLRVISSSPTNVQPVFDSIAESAVRLCSGQFSFVIRLDGEVMNFASCFGLSAEGLDVFRSIFPRAARDDTVAGRAILQRAIVELPDVEVDSAYGVQSQRLARTVNYRSIVGVPLLHDGNPIGAIAVARANSGSFPERQIALLQAFADQAVIAIRNVRLFDEVQARTEELSESLQQQTATSEILDVISNSPTDSQPAFDAIVRSGLKLFPDAAIMIALPDGDIVRGVAIAHTDPAGAEALRARLPLPLSREFITSAAILDRREVDLPDAREAPAELAAGARNFLASGYRAITVMPMMRDELAIGTVNVMRRQPGSLSEKQRELLRTFANQAVIAIENTRLFSELRQSLQQQTATADVLKVISRSTFDLQTVLDALVESAARLCDADSASIHRPRGNSYPYVASYGLPREYDEYMRERPLIVGRGTVLGRAVTECKPIQVNDVEVDPEYTLKEGQRLAGFRTVLGIPLLREGAPIGVIMLTRNTVRPFTDKQIELATTFADQAAIAIENVRLFEAEQQRTQELARSLEELRTAQDRLVQTQKLASLGQLTAGIAHEIKNPLNFVNNFSGVSVELIDELQDTLKRVTADASTSSEYTELMETLRGNLDKIVQHGKRADSIVKNMLLHSREGSGEHRPVDINAVLEESLNLAYHGARAEKQGFNITLERSFDPRAGEVDLFPQEITRVFLNLISNGFYAATKRKLETGDERYEPVLAAATKNLGDRVEIRIRDNGTGVPPEVRERMFNPFFTTKPAGEGTGLGLSISHDIIVKQHAGTIEVVTQPGEFTEFRIVLPRTAAFLAKTGGRA